MNAKKQLHLIIINMLNSNKIIFNIYVIIFLLNIILSSAVFGAQTDLKEALKNLNNKTSTTAEKRLSAVANIALGEYGKAYFILKKIPNKDRDPFVSALFYEIYSKLDMVEEASKELENIKAVAVKGKKLSLPKVIFCRKIMGFGMYHPFNTNHFYPGQLILIYSEVDNFTRVKNNDLWEIDLKVGISISTELGEPLYRNDNFSNIQFKPKSPIRDLWLTSRLTIPKTVQKGKKYNLIITVTDTASASVVSKAISFIGAME